MTIQEFASKSRGSAIIKVVLDGVQMLVFDTQYWQYITEEILDLEISSFEINNQLMKKAEVTVYVGVLTEDDITGDDFDDFDDDEEDDFSSDEEDDQSDDGDDNP